MMRLLLGPERFRKGTDLYFSRHDGQARHDRGFREGTLEDAAGADLSQFRRWYTQAGTPELTVTGRHDAAARTFSLTVRQSCPPTPGQPEKLPFHVPLALGLLGKDGKDLALKDGAGTHVLELRENPHPSLHSFV